MKFGKNVAEKIFGRRASIQHEVFIRIFQNFTAKFWILIYIK